MLRIWRPGILISTTLLCLLPGIIPEAMAQFSQQGTGLISMAGDIAVSADGNTLIAGRYGDNNFTGGAFVFTRANGSRQAGVGRIEGQAEGAPEQIRLSAPRRARRTSW